MTLLLLLRPRAPFIPALPEGRSTVTDAQRLSAHDASLLTLDEESARLTVEEAA